MKAHFFSLAIAVSLLVNIVPSYACTSAIFTGKATPDGRPLIWKHRDTGELNNRMAYYPVSSANKYSFIGLLSSPSEGEIWYGSNSEGFVIMNTASYNLQEKKADMEDQEGIVMCKALGCCKNLADFEKMLDKMKRPIGVEANFGVIDAEGGAAYYEVNNYEWRKVDVNDPKIAPEGFLIYTNHSYTGRINDGSGYIRYANAHRNIYTRWIKGEGFTPEWIFDNLSRSFYNSILDYDLCKTPQAVQGGWFIDQDFIPRRSTSAAIVAKGVKKGEDPSLTIMWAVLGYPPCGIAVPLFAAAGDKMPACMIKGSEGNNCKMCDENLARRAKVFSNKRANAKNYFNFSLLYNEEGTGYMQLLHPYEASNFEVTEEFMAQQYEKGKLDPAAVGELYKKINFGELVK